MSNVEAIRTWSDRTMERKRKSKTANEEWANALTHGLGLGLSLPASGLLLQRAFHSGSLGENVACWIYASSLVAVYAASTMSHWVQEPGRKSRFEAWDQGLIYLLIAGNFTPFAVTCFHGWWHLITIAMWTLALAGFVSKVVFRKRVNSVSLSLYLGLGWMAALGLPQLFAVAPASACWLAVGGGIAYSVGAALLINDHRVPYMHVGWHCLVIVGSICHYVAVWQCVGISA